MDLHNLRVPSFLYTGHDSGYNNQVSMNSRDLPFPGDASGLDQIVNKTKSPDSFCVGLSACSLGETSAITQCLPGSPQVEEVS